MKRIKLSNIGKGWSPFLDDYLAHLKILLGTEDAIMQCGLIFPAIGYIQDAIHDTMEAIKEQVIRESGLSEEIKKIFENSSTNHAWDWNEDFKKWRKEKGGMVNFKRKEGKR